MTQFNSKKPLLVKKNNLLIGIVNPLYSNLLDLCGLHVSDELSVVYEMKQEDMMIL